MSETNLYSPPRAAVADVPSLDDEVQAIRLWSTRGRIGRLRFLAYNAGGYLIMALASGVLAAVGTLIHPTLGRVGVAVGVLAYVVFCVFAAIQRAHDMDWSGWSVLLMIIPVAGLVWIFKGGTPGRNQFGAPPPPNTWGVRVLALVMPTIMVIGILAAIALPAYQQYTLRAKAAQVGH